MNNPIKIVTLGDSITHAARGYNSYRRNLWNRLAKDGYTVDFVGSQNRTYHGTRFPDSKFDPDHEGHSGWRIDEINKGREDRPAEGSLPKWLKAYTPDIALVHLGSNDAVQGQSAASSAADLKQTIQILRNDNPNIPIFLAQLIPAVPTKVNQALKQINALIPGIVAQTNRKNSPVILVDQHTGVNATQNNYDNLHPNEKGEAEMARRWFAALKPYLEDLDSSPAAPPVPAVPVAPKSNLTQSKTTLQAEKALLTGAVIRNAFSGAQGSGYADFVKSKGESVEWSVNSKNAGFQTISFRYALGATRSRNLALEVNGRKVRKVNFDSTGKGKSGWRNWENRQVSVSLAKGNNTIRLVSTGQSGPNIDSLTVAGTQGPVRTPAPKATPKPAPTPEPKPVATPAPTPEPSNTPNSKKVTLQAESAKLIGAVVDNDHGGAQGRGYVDFVKPSGEAVEWTVNAKAGVQSISFRYALGSPASRKMAVEVNGKRVSTVAFNSTGAGGSGWRNWRNKSVNAALKNGNNKIRLVTIGDSGPNIDSITIAGTAGTGSTPTPKATPAPTSKSVLTPAPSPTPTASTATLQAESAKLKGAVVDNTHAGAQGRGYADFVKPSGDSVEWTVNTKAVSRSISFRYALGSPASRSLALEVNGKRVRNVKFISTGTGASGWQNWRQQAVNVVLAKGKNTIRLVATGQSGPNIDSLTITQSKGSTSANNSANNSAIESDAVSTSLIERDESASSNSITGDSGDNSLVGTNGNNVLNGRGGNDTLAGKAGNDILNGDDGNDILLGNMGDDVLNGDAGNDTLIGGPASNGPQIDRLNGSVGNDVYVVESIYNGAGDLDYALIQTFDPAEDTIRLGDGNYQLKATTGDFPSGTGIYEGNELLAIVEGTSVNQLDINAAYFVA